MFPLTLFSRLARRGDDGKQLASGQSVAASKVPTDSAPTDCLHRVAQLPLLTTCTADLHTAALLRTPHREGSCLQRTPHLLPCDFLLTFYV